MDYQNHQQYLREQKERNMKAFKNITSPLEDIQNSLLSPKKKREKIRYDEPEQYERQQRREARNRAKDLDRTTISKYGQVSAGLAMDSYTKNNYNIKTVIIDSEFRDQSSYPLPYDFSVKLTESIKNVIAVRLVRTEFYDTTNNTGFFVINQMRIPIQFYNINSSYLYLNGYSLTQTTNGMLNKIFTRITPGLEIYPSISSDITSDPFTYFLNPVEPKLRQFDIRLMNSDGTSYQLPNARVILTVVVYCKNNI